MRKKIEKAKQPRFAYCESVMATPTSVHHIRGLSEAGMKTGGGVDTLALCGRDLCFGWDTHVVKSTDDIMALAYDEPTYATAWRVCQGCADTYAVVTRA